MSSHGCPYCGRKLGSAGSLKSHYAQSVNCRYFLRQEAQNAPPSPGRVPSSPSPPSSPSLLGPSPFSDVDMAGPPSPDGHAQPPPEAPRPSRRHVEIVEEEDIDAPGTTRYYCDYPEPAGCYLTEDDGETPIKETTAFEGLRDAQHEAGLPPWHPFDSEKEWGLGKWLAESGVSQAS
ncbi:hypothetical protein GGX14DRAFT_397581 [Mycena pura]|uniref:Uncharacterized protein n=1 Tax=Mycena pura TaxID=153505 RepID=A0AAD6VBZ7_9AGAR|nr:hypothetical protein GGX14DRAFT_397581 [Mycena pura]